MIARVLFALSLLLVSATAIAQAPPPPISSIRIEPAAPAAGQVVYVVVQYIGCDFPQAGGETLTRVGNTIIFSPLLPIVACGTPPPTPPVNFPIGYFEPGSYALFYAPRTGNPAFDYVPLTIPFTVGPASIPALGTMGLAALVASLMAVAWFVRMRRARARVRAARP